MPQIKNILLPTDFSEATVAATQHAVAIAKRFNATLHLLHVIEDPLALAPIFESIPLPPRQSFETYAQDRLENWISDPDRDDLKLELHWLHGHPVTRIVEFAADHRMDLIVIGTHGRGVISHALLGSVAEKLLRQAPCPVMTIRGTVNEKAPQ